MARHLPLDHFCPWREEAEELRERLTALEAKTTALERHVFGRKAERLPGVQQLLRHEQAGEDTEALLAFTRKRGNLDRDAGGVPGVRHPGPR